MANRIKKASATYYINLATALQKKKGKLQLALRIIDAALARFPSDSGMIFCKARILRQSDKIEAAYATFTAGFEMKRGCPQTVLVYFVLI
jgi:predicted Zn-dependent protease